jgi:hypothetical protein
MTDLNDDDLVAITSMVLTQQGQQPIYQVDIAAQRVLSGKTLQRDGGNAGIDRRLQRDTRAPTA